MRERLRAKDNLLEECEKEIIKIRKNYEILDKAVAKQKAGLENRSVAGGHGLLKKGRSK